MYAANHKDALLQKLNFSDQNKIFLNTDFLDQIWIPDLYVYDLEWFGKRKTILDLDGIKVNKKTGPNSNYDVIVSYSLQPIIRFTCTIDFSNFPFQSPTCFLKMADSLETAESMVYKERFQKYLMILNDISSLNSIIPGN